MAYFSIANTAPNSTFIQLAPYLLVEYIYDSVLLDRNIYKIKSHVDGSVVLVNDDTSLKLTGNVRDTTVISSSDTNVVELQTERIPEYLLYTNKYTTTTIAPGQQKYDKVRFHLQTGFNFDQLDGIQIVVKSLERSGLELTLLSTLLSRVNAVARILYHPKPLFVRDRIFDKYFDCRILSTYEMNTAFYALDGTPYQSGSTAALLTSDGNGLIRQSPISFELYELTNHFFGGDAGATDANFDFYTNTKTKRISIKQADEHALLSVVLQESVEGFDYFEFFPTWDGQFIENYILYMNSTPGYSYIIMHEIKVYEQIDEDFVMTGSFNSLQESGYDVPQIFRPVLMNSEVATSFSIEYTMRLFNKHDGTQIVRSASIGSYDVHKWGKKLQMINIGDLARPFKVYNKLVTNSLLANTNSLEALPVPLASGHVYYDRAEIEVNTTGSTGFNVTLTPFDNIISLLVRDELFGNLITTGTTSYQLVFTFVYGEPQRFARIADSDLEKQTGGNMIFKILAVNARALLNSIKNIVSVFLVSITGKTETVIAQGTVFDTHPNTPNAPSLPPFSSQLTLPGSFGLGAGSIGIKFIEPTTVPVSIISQIKPESF